MLPSAPALPNPNHLHGGGGAWGATALHGSPWWREGRAPRQGDTQPQHRTQHQPRPAYPGDALAGRRAELCPQMPWTEVGGSTWAGPHLLYPNPDLPAAPMGPPVHPWGAHRAGFALALQMAAGATAKPLHWPGLGGGLESLSAGEQGRSHARSPCTSPRLPSRRRLHPALMSAMPGSWEK